LRDALKGITCFLRGLTLLPAPRVRRYAALPFALSALVLSALVWLAALQIDAWVEALLAYLPSWLSWLEWLFWVIFTLLAGGLVLFSFLIVVGIVGAPFHGPLAAAAERHLTGRAPEGGSLGQSLVRLPGTVFDELAKVAYCIALALPCLLLFFVPVVNTAAPVLWFVCCAWVAAFSYCDYAMSNHGNKLGDIRRALARRRALALGFGAAVTVALFVPVLNLLVVPAAVCGGAILWVEELRDDGSGPTSL
jgi:CysZ protein